MKRRLFSLTVFFTSALLLAGCAFAPSGGQGTEDSGQSGVEETAPSKRDNIPFAEGQAYAVAHLGYLEIENLDFYTQRYLDSEDLPVHYFSAGDYYLVIPRYEGTDLAMYRNDINTSSSTLVYEEPNCRPFIIQCNVSDIFPDATIRLTSEEGTVEFSPFISLKDGSLDVGEQGLDLTQEGNSGETA